VIRSSCFLFVSTPNTTIATTASASGMAPYRAVCRMEGAATAAATIARIMTPPNLVAPAASPDPRARTFVGNTSDA
jgi:hypothetical protein